LEAAEVAPEPVAFELWEEHAETLGVFLACGTQWNHAGMTGLRTGLHYPSVESVLRLTVSTERHPEVFAQLQRMEHAALQEFSRQAAAESNKR